MKPLVRKRELIGRKLGDQTLVYDLKFHMVHCLNGTTSVFRKHCDGATDAGEMAERRQNEIGLPLDESLAQIALQQLLDSHLIHASSVVLPIVPSHSRRVIAPKVPRGDALPIPVASHDQSSSVCGKGSVKRHSRR